MRLYVTICVISLLGAIICMSSVMIVMQQIVIPGYELGRHLVLECTIRHVQHSGQCVHVNVEYTKTDGHFANGHLLLLNQHNDQVGLAEDFVWEFIRSDWGR